jgi:lipopolysaccharide export system protein LptA
MPKSFLRGFSFALIAVFVFACATALAAQRSSGSGGKVPTSIKAASMEYNAQSQVVLFSGNVYVKRPDFELWASRMTIYLDKSARKNTESDPGAAEQDMRAGEIDRIVADKNVRMKSADKEGTCDKATYFAKEDKIVMEGGPVVLRDKDKSTIKGNIVTHYLSSNRSEVKGQGGVEAVFFTPDKVEKGGNSEQGK